MGIFSNAWNAVQNFFTGGSSNSQASTPSTSKPINTPNKTSKPISTPNKSTSAQTSRPKGSSITTSGGYSRPNHSFNAPGAKSFTPGSSVFTNTIDRAVKNYVDNLSKSKQSKIDAVTSAAPTIGTYNNGSIVQNPSAGYDYYSRVQQELANIKSELEKDPYRMDLGRAYQIKSAELKNIQNNFMTYGPAIQNPDGTYHAVKYINGKSIGLAQTDAEGNVINDTYTPSRRATDTIPTYEQWLSNGVQGRLVYDPDTGGYYNKAYTPDYAGYLEYLNNQYASNGDDLDIPSDVQAIANFNSGYYALDENNMPANFPTYAYYASQRTPNTEGGTSGGGSSGSGGGSSGGGSSGGGGGYGGGGGGGSGSGGEEAVSGSETLYSLPEVANYAAKVLLNQMLPTSYDYDYNKRLNSRLGDIEASEQNYIQSVLPLISKEYQDNAANSTANLIAALRANKASGLTSGASRGAQAAADVQSVQAINKTSSEELNKLIQDNLASYLTAMANKRATAGNDTASELQGYATPLTTGLSEILAQYLYGAAPAQLNNGGLRRAESYLV